jgi:CD81 antigen
LIIGGLQLHCCGVTGPRDWAGSKYNKEGRSALDLGVTSGLQIYKIPSSCCHEGTNMEICNAAVSTGIGAQISNVIYSEVSTDIACFILKKVPESGEFF